VEKKNQLRLSFTGLEIIGSQGEGSQEKKEDHFSPHLAGGHRK
jgi:hypothetical protein